MNTINQQNDKEFCRKCFISADSLFNILFVEVFV